MLTSSRSLFEWCVLLLASRTFPNKTNFVNRRSHLMQCAPHLFQRLSKLWLTACHLAWSLQDHELRHLVAGPPESRWRPTGGTAARTEQARPAPPLLPRRCVLSTPLQRTTAAPEGWDPAHTRTWHRSKDDRSSTVSRLYGLRGVGRRERQMGTEGEGEGLWRVMNCVITAGPAVCARCISWITWQQTGQNHLQCETQNMVSA
jgi:hypothetical protein